MTRSEAARRRTPQDPTSRNDARAGSAADPRIAAVIRQVPAGEVATYGQIAFVLGLGSARIVGRALATLPAGQDLPWHRIINSQGKISDRKDGGGGDLRQRRLLRAEGVHFDSQGRVDFKTVAWQGPGWQWLDSQGFDLEDLALRSQQLRRRGAWCRWRL